MAFLCVNELLIEVTRRCNMSCQHCCRGDAQNMDITDKVLEQIAQTIRPCSVVFSGGEPSLNVRAIAKYFELAEKYNSLPSSFYVVTNGKVNQVELATTLLAAYAKMDEPECCGLAVSSDIFHDRLSSRSLRVFEGLSFYREREKKHPLTEIEPDWVLYTGRAITTGVGKRTPEDVCGSFEEWLESGSLFEDEVYVDMTYVSANGNVVDVCDISYEDMDANRLCHVSELPEKLNAYVQSCCPNYA